jgi:hypothetical protein
MKNLDEQATLKHKNENERRMKFQALMRQCQLEKE